MTSSKLTQNTLYYTLGNLLPRIAQLFLLPLFTKFLSPADYGIVQSMQVLSTILSVIFTLALERSIYRLYYDYKSDKDRKNFLGTIFISILTTSTIFLLIILLGKAFVSNIFSTIPFSPYYLYTVFSVYLTIFSLIPMVYFQVEQKGLHYIFISLLDFVLYTMLVIFLIVNMGRGAEGMLLGRLLTTALMIPLYVFIIAKIIHFKFSFVVMKESFSYSWPLVFMLLASWIINLSDRIFIERYSTLKEVGLYSIAYKISEVILIISIAFNKAYDPLFYQLANQEDQALAKKKLTRYNNIYTIALIYGSLLVSLFAKELIHILDQEYRDAVELIPIIIIGILIGEISGIFNRSIYQVKKTKLITILTISSALINIGLNFIFVPKNGALGAAYATLITFIFFFIIKYYLSIKCYFIPFLWKNIIQAFALYFAIILFFNLIQFEFITQIIIKVIVSLGLLFFILLRNKDQLLLIFKSIKE